MKHIFALSVKDLSVSLVTEGSSLTTALPLLGYMSTLLEYSKIKRISERVKQESYTLSGLLQFAPPSDGVAISCEYDKEENYTTLSVSGLNTIEDVVKVIMTILLTLEHEQMDKIVDILGIYLDDVYNKDIDAQLIINHLSDISVALVFGDSDK